MLAYAYGAHAIDWIGLAGIAAYVVWAVRVSKARFY